jgi:hypothetical protein
VELHQLNNNQALLFDVATRTDAFRKNQCLKDVLHILPSRAMRADALAQYMLKKRCFKAILNLHCAPLLMCRMPRSSDQSLCTNYRPG